MDYMNSVVLGPVRLVEEEERLSFYCLIFSMNFVSLS